MPYRPPVRRTIASINEPLAEHRVLMDQINAMHPGVKKVFMPHFRKDSVLSIFNSVPALGKYKRYLPSTFYAPNPRDGIEMLKGIIRDGKLDQFVNDMYLYYPQFDEESAKHRTDYIDAKNLHTLRLSMNRRHTARSALMHTDGLPKERRLSIPPELMHTVGSYVTKSANPNGGRRTRRTRRR